MDIRLAIAVAFISATVTPLLGQAKEEKLSPVEKFRATTQFHMVMCRLEERKAALNQESGDSSNPYESIRACIKTGKANAKADFSKAAAQTSKKPTASKALKDFYACWLTAFEGIAPGASERKIDYQKRQTDSEAHCEELWHRFEIEAGL